MTSTEYALGIRKIADAFAVRDYDAFEALIARVSDASGRLFADVEDDAIDFYLSKMMIYYLDNLD